MSAIWTTDADAPLEEGAISMVDLLEVMRDAILVYDLDGRIVEANGRAANLFGYAVEELRGALVENLLPCVGNETPVLYREAWGLAATRSQARGKALTLVARRKDGIELPLDISLSPLRFGRRDVVLCAARDVNLLGQTNPPSDPPPPNAPQGAKARRRKSKRSAKSRRFLQATIDALSSHVAVLDTKGKILTVNAAWRSFALENGSPHADFVGWNYVDTCYMSSEREDEPDPSAVLAADGIRDVISGARDDFGLEYLCPSDATIRSFGMRVTPFAERAPRRVVVAHTDITERKLAEETLRYRLRWEKLIADLSTRFIDLPADSGDAAISEALASVSDSISADRAYVFLLEEDGTTPRAVYSHSNETIPHWLAFPIAPWRTNVRAEPDVVAECEELIAVIVEHLHMGESFRVPSLASLPPGDPARRVLAAQKIRSLLCVPVVHQHRVIGFLAVDKVVRERDWLSSDKALLQTVAEILANAISRWRAEELLRSIVEGISASTGEAFLSSLVEHICRGLELDYALIGEVHAEGRIRTLALHGPSGAERNIEYDLAGTPCGDVVRGGALCLYRKDVTQQFPENDRLAEMGISAYAGVPLFDSDGNIMGHMCIMHRRPFGATTHVVDALRVFAARAAAEIDRRHKDEALRAWNHALEQRVVERAAVVARQAAAMDATTEGMAIIGGDLFVYANDAYAQIFGHPLGEALLGTSWRDLFPPSQAERIEADVTPVVVSTGRFSGEITGMRHDGTLFDLSISLTSFGGDIICCCHDITQRKRIQRELAASRDELCAANAELAAAARLKNEFLASMSHELRTPLNAILGMSEVLIEEMVGALNTRQMSSIKIVQESGRHLLSLINDILDLSKIEAGKLELVTRKVDVRAVCDASIRLVRPTAQAKKHEIVLDAESDFGVARADERRLKQMLVNLLDNAAKFTPPGGKIGLDVRRDPLRSTISFTVWDTGVGIAPEDTTRLFQAFTQLDQGLAKQHPGTGLGLSLVKRLAELHEGHVSVESKLGRGSRFTITLPDGAPPSENEASMPPPSVAARGGAWQTQAPRRSVLVVDDNEPNLRMLGDFLTIKHYRVLTAYSGKDALEILGLEEVDAVLMDIQMPGMDGLEVIRTIRMNPQHAALPIIAVTALAMPGDRERCLDAGSNEYITKPLSPKQLATTLARLIRG